MKTGQVSTEVRVMEPYKILKVLDELNVEKMFPLVEHLDLGSLFKNPSLLFLKPR